MSLNRDPNIWQTTAETRDAQLLLTLWEWALIVRG